MGQPLQQEQQQAADRGTAAGETHPIYRWTCTSMTERTVRVDGVPMSCEQMPVAPATSDGWYYFDVFPEYPVLGGDFLARFCALTPGHRLPGAVESTEMMTSVSTVVHRVAVGLKVLSCTATLVG